jgi:hypothetical protein
MHFAGKSIFVYDWSFATSRRWFRTESVARSAALLDQAVLQGALPDLP